MYRHWLACSTINMLFQEQYLIEHRSHSRTECQKRQCLQHISTYILFSFLNCSYLCLCHNNSLMLFCPHSKPLKLQSSKNLIIKISFYQLPLTLNSDCRNNTAYTVISCIKKQLLNHNKYLRSMAPILWQPKHCDDMEEGKMNMTIWQLAQLLNPKMAFLRSLEMVHPYRHNPNRADHRLLQLRYENLQIRDMLYILAFFLV